MADQDIQRKLSAIMFTDIVGYTKMMGRNETDTLAFLNFHDHLLRLEIDKNGGKVIKTIGDAFLADFSSAVNAVRCAVSIQGRLEDHNRTTGESRQLRIGIHIGDVVVSNNDILGDGVNIASRLESIAEPGGIYVSEDVYHHIKNMPEFSTVFAGAKDLKNIDRKIGVYQVTPPGKGKTRKPAQTRKTIVFFLALALVAGMVGWFTSPAGQEWLGSLMAKLPFTLNIWGFRLGPPPPTPVPTPSPVPTVPPTFTATATSTSTSTPTAIPTPTPKPKVKLSAPKKKPKPKPQRARAPQEDGIEATSADEDADVGDAAPTPRGATRLNSVLIDGAIPSPEPTPPDQLPDPNDLPPSP
ncbi:MAG TPA: adenylate/guanylate cyclase domain-containing protein [bacterium]|nr:adenylate/guanylate cyclase domain-containing protein [bacterium]